MRTLIHFVRATSTAGLALALVACGGGSSSTSGNTVSYPLQAGLQQLTQRTGTLNFTWSGKSNGATVSGSGTTTDGSLTPDTFQGSAAYSQTSTTASTFVTNGIVNPVSTVVSIAYSDYNYLPLGNVGSSSYWVADRPYSIPNAASVGNAGTLFSGKIYNNSSNTLTGTDVFTWSLSADTDQTALLTVTETIYNTNSAATNVSRQVLRMTTSGYLTRLYDTFTPSDTGETLIRTYQ